jgi:TolB-like protein/DNA-binding winged helix-turn-helix (wHTH) protein
MSNETVASGWIAFDNVDIDVTGHRLLINGEEVALERKAFAVLVLLARAPGRVFTRDEILDAVWGHSHVTPGVLNRIIAMLRHALGEDAEESRYLTTVHGIGYRLDAELRALATRAGSGARAESLVSPASPAAQFDIPATVVRAADDTPQSTSLAAPATRGDIAMPSVTAAASASEPVKLAPPSRIRAGHRLGLAAALLAIGAAVIYFNPWHKVSTPPAPAGVSPTLVVLPLRPVGGTPDDMVLAEGLSEELITRLARTDGLRLISRTSAERAQEDKLDLNQLSARLHVTHALEGSLRQEGQQLRIDLRLIDVSDGRTLWAQNYDRNFSEVFAIQSEVAQSVADTLALKLGLHDRIGEEDPQSFRDYLELRRSLVERPDITDYAPALDKLRALVARVPNYARAHGLLARVLVHELQPALVSKADYIEASHEAARALELDADQIEAHAALATIACRNTEWDPCFKGFVRVLTLTPTDALMRAAYAKWLAGIGYLDQGLREAEASRSSDPLVFGPIFIAARILDTLGRHDEALPAVIAATNLQPAAPTYGRWTYGRWFNAIWRHDYAAARELAAQMSLAEGFHDAYVAATEAIVDPSRWPQVEPLIATSEKVSGRMNYLRLQLPNPDFPKVIAALEEPLKSGSSSYNLLLWNPENAALRRDPAFQDFLKRNHIIDYWRSNGWPPQCKPEGDGARCD